MRYRVTLTRQVTERAEVVIDAASSDDAEAAAYNAYVNGTGARWHVMDNGNDVVTTYAVPGHCLDT